MKGIINIQRILLLLFGLSLVLLELPGCKDKEIEPVEPTEPFVRLLKEQTYWSHILKREMNYAVLLPKEYENSTDSFPVVYLLHGYGDDETAWYQWGNIQSYVDLYAAETIPMIYVMPEAFNTYYVNKYNGNYPIMDVLVSELVPAIDSVFRTIKDAGHRAVMGYSMGGYGALILPAKNPEIFRTGVVLSMSFRTDAQYMGETQSVFNSQWGSVFGGIDASGTNRLTEYFISYSPFHFFTNQSTPSLNGLNYFISCGDDEETLSVTSDTLHDLLRNLNYPHAYRMKSGGHSWSYWHKELPEALKYISYAVQQIPYPSDPVIVDFGAEIPSNRIIDEQLEGTNISFQIVLPEGYSDGSNSYPVVMVLHDYSQEEQQTQIISLFSRLMAENKSPQTLVINVPVQEAEVTGESLQNVLNQVKGEYRVQNDNQHAVLIGNGEGGRMAFEMIQESADLFNACMLFDATLPENASINITGVDFYLDICDQGINYKSYHSLYVSLRNNEVNHEYRVRQGSPSHDSFLNGIEEASSFIKSHLNN